MKTQDIHQNQNTTPSKKCRRGLLCLGAILGSLAVTEAQTTYTGGPENWSESYADRVYFGDPINGPFTYYSGDFTPSSPYSLGLWSSGNSPYSNQNMGQVEGRTFTTNGSNSGANQALSAGQSFMLLMGGSDAGGGRTGIETNGRIGFALARGTNIYNGSTLDGSDRANGGTEGMMRVEFVGGQSNAQIMSGPGAAVTQSAMPTFADFKSGQYYRVDILSDNEFTLKYGSTSATSTQAYNIIDFMGTGSIGRIQVYNLGANMDALYGSIVVSNMAEIALTSNTGENKTVSGVISDNTNSGSANHVAKEGAGIVNLTNANTYTGNTTINSGTLAVSNSNALGTSGNVSVAKNAKLGLSGNISISRPMLLNGSNSSTPSVYSSSGCNTVAGHITVSGTTTELGTGTNSTLSVTGGISGNQEVALSAAAGSKIIVSGSGITTTGSLGLETRGAGLVLLNATNTFNGLMLLDGDLEVGSAGRLQSGNATFGIQIRNGNLVYSGTANQILSGALTDPSGVGTGTLTHNSTGTLTLTGNSTYNKAVAINSGTLEVGSNGRLGAGNLTAAITNNGAFVHSSANNQTLSGGISGSGSLTKSGSSTLTLAGSSTYLGATTVSGGTLAVTGSINNSTATIQNGATIRGSGSVGGLILNNGSTLAPGNSPGTFSTLGNATWNGGANLNWQVVSTNTNPAVQTGAGTGWDFFDVGGTLTLGLSTSNKFNINLWSLSGTGPDVNGIVPGWDPAVGSTWLIATADGGINLNGTNLNANTDYSSYFNINTAATNGAGGWYGGLPSSFQILTLGNSNNLYLQALASGSSAVPEPGQIAASFLLAAAAGIHFAAKQIRLRKMKIT